MKPRTVVLGSPEFAVPTLEALVDAGYPIATVYTQPDRPVRRGRQLIETPPPVKRRALELGLAVRQPPERLRGDALTELADLAPELIVVAAYGLILSRRVLDLPRHGCLNVHASLLPRHRGAAPISGAILAGDAVTGVSIMQMDPGIDTGPVLARAEEPIRPDDTAGSLTPRLARLGADLLLATLPDWLAGRIAPEPQDDSRATYWPMIRREDARIDWSRPAVEIERQVRAYQPWPVAFTTWGDRDIRVLAAEVVEVSLPPGEVRASRAAGLAQMPRAPLVGTGSGSLVLHRIQPAGGRPVDGAGFLNGHPGILGARLG